MIDSHDALRNPVDCHGGHHGDFEEKYSSKNEETKENIAQVLTFDIQDEPYFNVHSYLSEIASGNLYSVASEAAPQSHVRTTKYLTALIR